MSHDLEVAITAGSSWKHLTCDDVKEQSKGIFLYELSDGEREKIGYVPYENLGYVSPNEEE